METKKLMTGTTQKRKLLLLAPLIAIPLLTLLFWAAGGGDKPQKDTTVKKGFNINLPNAKNEEDGQLSKFNYYESAALDSAKMEELRKKDPNYTNAVDSIAVSGTSQLPTSTPAAKGLNMGSPDPAEEKLVQKLEQLKKAIHAPPPAVRNEIPAKTDAPVTAAHDIQRLEQMMHTLQNQEPEDREMQQINGMLENILDIQYPQRLQEKMKKASEAERGQVFPVQDSPAGQPVSLLESNPHQGTAIFTAGGSHNRFYSLDEEQDNTARQNAVLASIAETQTIVNGTTVKMKLGQDIYVDGTRIPSNTFIYGVAALKGERLTVKVTSIRHGNSLFPVDLSVHDLDGLDGIFIPGAINRDVAKASADQSMQSLGVTTLDDSWSSQAAGAGIEAAKTLFSKKVKLVKVVVKSGYQVLLKDKKEKK
ncbi:conjugative transposon protein TraM [Flavobacterium coralii]|uniref:conjugative transposon protein TraM n=1 Tax=Flavobacterium coralii TaxID=2838017 RepID=UPI000C43DAA9|nr:conjugative transposon protein TraM [Flavobacterium sp.]|tara:strand:+ start:9931 stop:11193 length:1263 start_codon:yes stop_codon:yes gene_type:complete